MTECGLGGFGSMKALSVRNDAPESASRPFDRDRDGFVIGEGAGALVLEEEAHARKRGARIYAEIIGGGMTADAYHITAPHPEGLGAEKVMRSVLHFSGIQPREVDYINAHGTSTPLGDISEVLAIRRVFGDHAEKLNISSTKSMTGHLLGPVIIPAPQITVAPDSFQLGFMGPQQETSALRQLVFRGRKHPKSRLEKNLRFSP